MDATASTRTHSLGQRSIVFAALLALLSWSFVVSSPLIADADHDAEQAGPQLEALVAPTFVPGNPTCGDIYDTVEFKVEGDVSTDEDVQSGTYHFDEDGDFLSYDPGSTPQSDDDAHFSVHIDVYQLEDETWEGPVFDFEVLTDHGIRGVVAKGGEDANLYDYAGVDDTHVPTSEADGFTVTADETLHSPHNRDNRFFGVSHISFCPGEAPEEEPDVHALSVTKTVDGDPLGEGDEFEFVLYPTDAEGDPVVEEGVTRTVTAEDDTATWTDLEDGDFLLCETGLEEGWSIGWPEGLTVESVMVEGDTFECVVVVVDGDDVSFTVDNISPEEEPDVHALSVTKTVDGDPLGEGDEFEFVLYPTDAEGDPVVEEGVTRTVTAEDDTATWTDLEDGDFLLCETGLEEGWSIGWPEGLTVESVMVEGDTFECVVVVVEGDDVSFTVDNISPDEPVEPVGIIADITKTNDADGDGEFSDEEVAEDEGDAVDFELEIFNDNPVDVIVVELTDSYGDVVIDLLAGEVLDGEATLANNTCAGLDGATIPANESVTCTFTLEGYAPAEGEDVTNVAFVELEDPETGETADADDTSNVGTVEEAVLPEELEPDIELVKEADVSEAEVGDEITYTYTVTNTGDTTLTDITLDDDVLGEIELESTTLEPGESTTGTATHTVTEDDLEAGEVVNVAIVTGWPPEGEAVTDDDDETVQVVEEVVEEVLAEELPATGFDALQALFAALLALSLGGVTLLGLRLHELRSRMYGTA